ncbi:MAG: glutamate racemase [Prevotellaceae bacterium]|nr:glutamate racemase [Prevotellaceae bacterium]
MPSPASPPVSSPLPQAPGPVGVFDSGYGGLTVLRDVRALLPQYDYLYLGDNARAPYGTRSFELVYQFTLQAVLRLFRLGCHLVILACNTASAKALRSIQQTDLPSVDPSRRVLGVVRPTAEIVGTLTRSRHVGLFATPGTVRSSTYDIEISRLHPDIRLTSLPCPMWVPLVENGEHLGPGADYFVRQPVRELFRLDPLVDTLLLGCTHYPLLLPKLRQFVPREVTIVSQGTYVASSLAAYLRRHPDMEVRLTRGGTARFLTTERPSVFDVASAAFLDQPVTSEHVTLP